MSGKKFRAILLTGLITVASLWLGALSYSGPAMAAGQTAVVTGTVVNVRSGPDTGYSKVSSVYQGESFEILEQKSGWYKLKLVDGGSGWVIGEYLKISESGSGEPSAQNETVAGNGKNVVINVTYVNVRSGPGVVYAKVTTLDKGRRLNVIRESGGWYNVELENGKDGWVAGWLVTAQSTSQTPAGNQPPTGGTPTGTPAPGDNNSGANIIGQYLIVKESTVNVRSGPGTAYSLVAKVVAGNQFAIISQVGEWYKINLSGGKQGWIAGWLTEIRTVNTPSRQEPEPSVPPGSNPDASDPDNGQETPDPGPGQDNQSPDSGTDDSRFPKLLQSIETVSGENGSESIVIKSQGQIKYQLFTLKGPDRLVIDFMDSDINGLQDISPGWKLLKNVRVAQFSLSPMMVRVVLDLNRTVSYVSYLSADKQSFTVTLSEPKIDGKVIVIDAGHGGYDPGALGVTGLEEKRFNLDTALMLRDKLTGLGARVIMTREDDSFVSLTRRAATANEVYAEVFISIHANSSENAATNGTSTYFYAPSSNQELYAQRAQRERLAWAVQNNLISRLGTKNVGVLESNFSVLRGTNMPSILVESAFLSNSSDEKLLKDSGFREKVAQGIADGLVAYFNN